MGDAVTLHPAPVVWSATLLDQARQRVEALRDEQQRISALWYAPHTDEETLRRAEAEWVDELLRWDRSVEAAAIAAWREEGRPPVPGLAPELLDLLHEAASW